MMSAMGHGRREGRGSPKGRRKEQNQLIGDNDRVGVKNPNILQTSSKFGPIEEMRQYFSQIPGDHFFAVI